MTEKATICPNRIRNITGSFAFVEHRFLREGFLQNLIHHELLLYLFFVLAGDRNGLSCYSYDEICTLLRISIDEYLLSRNALIDKDVIAFDGSLFQVLSLPQHSPISPPRPLKTKGKMERHDPATINRLIAQSLTEADYGL